MLPRAFLWLVLKLFKEICVGYVVDIQLLGTSGCHLCEVAEKKVRMLAPQLGISVKKLDIASSDALVEQYGLFIPVLRSESGQELFWPFDEDQIEIWSKSL